MRGSVHPIGAQGAFLREKFGKGLLPLGESLFQLAADEQRVRYRADDTETDFIIYYVADQRSGHISAGFRQELMAMMPALEWTFVLHIHEVRIPFKFRDASDPACADRQQRENAKGSDDGRPHPGCLGEDAITSRRGRHAAERNQLGRARSRHDPRQVFRIRKKEKHGFPAKRHPLLEFEMVMHNRPSAYNTERFCLAQKQIHATDRFRLLTHPSRRIEHDGRCLRLRPWLLADDVPGDDHIDAAIQFPPLRSGIVGNRIRLPESLRRNVIGQNS